MTACGATRRYLTAPTAWKLPGRWWIPFLSILNRTNQIFPTTRRGPGVLGKPTNCWSAMADTGENLNAKAGPREILPGVLVYRNPDEVARGAARLFVDYAWQAISRYGKFMVALSGGNTPRAMFQFLASPEFRGQVDWAKVHVFWSDERAVPRYHTDSNYGMARSDLLLRVPIPLSNVHRMEAEKPNIGRAAHDYEEVLRQYLELDDRGFPKFHLIFLGMGPEGHRAPLFPGTRRTRPHSPCVS